MTSQDSTICFVSGASRGLGLALVTELLTRYPTAIVYAGVRDVSKSPTLDALAAKHSAGKLHIVQWIAADKESNESVARVIQKDHGHVDVVIANAAVSKSINTPASETSIDDFRDMLEVNAIGVLMLFQSLFPLLKASKHPSGPKFIPISTGAASLTSPWIAENNGLTGYGASKTAMNYVARKIHFENEWLLCFPIAPGVVETDMLAQYKTSDKSGETSKYLESISKTPEDTARMLIDVIDSAKRETHGGEFLNYSGGKSLW